MLQVSSRISKHATCAALSCVAVVAACADEAGQIRRTSGVENIYQAVQVGDVRAVERFLDRGDDADTADPNTGLHLLHLSASSGRRDITSLLIAHRADPNVLATASFVSPLEGAIQFGHYAIAIDLLQAGADPNLRHPAFLDSTALSYLLVGNRGNNPEKYYELLRSLLVKGANVADSLSTTMHTNALDVAVINGDVRAFHILWCWGARNSSFVESDETFRRDRDRILRALEHRRCEIAPPIDS